MNRRAMIASAVSAAALAGCSSPKYGGYRGPEVTSIVINKGARRMYLLHQEDILKEYKVDLGFAPDGDKKVRGDGKTPEGTYLIDRRNPNSDFFLSLGISYPNSKDRAEAKALGKEPGGDIFIHGQPNQLPGAVVLRHDWTAGCIAVANHEIEELWRVTPTGTPVEIRP